MRHVPRDNMTIRCGIFDVNPAVNVLLHKILAMLSDELTSQGLVLRCY